MTATANTDTDNLPQIYYCRNRLRTRFASGFFLITLTKNTMNTAEILALIRRISREENVDENYMLKVAAIESQFDPNATNPSSRAAGLFQILPMNNVKNVYDPAVNTRWTARFTRENEEYLRRNGLPINHETLYLAHQQGRGGAVAIWKAKEANQNIQNLPPQIQRNMNANNPRKYTSVRDWYEFWAKKMRSMPNPQNSTNEPLPPIAARGNGTQQGTTPNNAPNRLPSGTQGRPNSPTASSDSDFARKQAQERKAREQAAYEQAQRNRQAGNNTNYTNNPNEAGTGGLGTILLLSAAGGLLWFFFAGEKSKPERASYSIQIAVEEEEEEAIAEVE
jgi:hypothetical protein